jgi:hypothetical protein
LSQHRLDAIDGRDDVGAWLTLDGENDGWLAIGPPGEQIVFGRVDCLADVAHPHRRAIAIGDD